MDYYSTLAPGYNELHKKEQLAKLRIISNHLKIQENDRLLDLGCGTGFTSEIFNCYIIGLEPSKEMLIQGKKEGVHKMNFLQGEGEHLPFYDNSFDLIICVTALHNFKNPKAGLKEIKRVGKGKGAITILKKAKHAQELKDSVNEIFTIQKEIEEDKDIILFFGLGKL
ncbi:class I SAM-dependent methyltransferase [Candidatus Pacearchaeota archaeon]|nr:class I SAM-dependent methyltransferase [Candidatus Pacearchaeota archaeon]